MLSPRQTPRPHAPRRGATAVVLAVITLLAALAAPAGASSAYDRPSGDGIYLVTLTGPGTAGGADPRTIASAQEGVLRRAEVSAAPLYTWRTALSGFAARLSAEQAATIAADPAVRMVEANAVRRTSGREAGLTRDTAVTGRLRGGAGIVIGVVDTGIDPSAAGLSAVPGLGEQPADFNGECVAGERMSSCDGKIVGARWFVDGFGEDRLASRATLSARDDDGHGTAMASIAAGNPGVSVSVPGTGTGTHSGQAPQARLAAYKACWTAPDPADDGCATADLVSAIDAATADGVDVLNLSVAGPGDLDTVETALLGAREAGVITVAAAGTGAGGPSAHPSPWVLSVGATAGAQPRGEVRADGLSLMGAMAADSRVHEAPVVLGSQAAAPGRPPAAARHCSPGSLDAARVADRIVVCERGGGVGRTDKSATVARADGVGMILVNADREPVVADFHAVPTVHLDRAAANTLLGRLRGRPDTRVSLLPRASARPDHPLGTSRAGDPRGAVIKPDLVAPGAGVLAAVPAATGRWALVGGTSAATAITSGTAAVLLARTGWSPDLMTSALITTAGHVSGPVLRTGGGTARLRAAQRPGLVFPVSDRDLRAWFEGRLRGPLNTPSVQLDTSVDRTARTVTNTTRRARYFSVRVRGIQHHDVRVRPAALRLAPGESGRFTVAVAGESPRRDDGRIVWRGSTGTVTKIPIVISR
ncbi:S8 family serine peptidase [Nocardioides insulae]|uniref:S8 family serine peptidase n=1 Tax=Nocardioides insulae TaxID=394734 RepID=UPI0003F8F0C2|nr:S8 family serine peptidase [Nocardioides insulae]